MADELPPLWALDRAAKAAEQEGWSAVASNAGTIRLRQSIIAHARMIAQYEQPPEPRDLVMARRICSAVAREIGHTALACSYEAGTYDEGRTIDLIRALLRKYAGEKA